MSARFNPSEWETVLPRSRRRGMFASPYLEPASIVAQETGGELEECIACGQLRERVVAVVVEEGIADLCSDCRRKYDL